MRIGIDMLGAQAAGRTRGVGRYSRQLVSRLLAEPGPHDYLLYFHAGLAGADEAWPGAAAIRWLEPDDAGAIGGAVRRLSVENPDRLDLLLLSNPLENFRGYLPPQPPAGGLRMATIVYDLIPALFPQHYLRHPAIADAYRRALAALEQYDLLLTISDAGRDDCLRLLRTAADRIVNISAAGDESRFFLTDAARDSEADAAATLERHGILAPFVFSLTALDHRKNLAGALSAFESLPSELRQSHRLVLTCAMSSDDDYARLQSIVARSPAAERIVLTGPLGDDALRVMYQRCAAFLFPSRYEGFGLPIWEALQCGAAVVAGRNSSQIEVLGEAGLLADAESPGEIAAQLRRVLADAELSQELRRAAPQQAQKFRWELTAERCRAALEATVARPPAAGRIRRLLTRSRLAVAERLHRRGLGAIEPAL